MASFVVEIANIIKNKQTPKVLGLRERVATLKLWCKKKCEELKIDPGSECMLAMHQITLKMDEHHEQIMAGQATTYEKQDQMGTKLTRIEDKIDACARVGRRSKQLAGAELEGMYSIWVPHARCLDRNTVDQWYFNGDFQGSCQPDDLSPGEAPPASRQYCRLLRVDRVIENNEFKVTFLSRDGTELDTASGMTMTRDKVINGLCEQARLKDNAKLTQAQLLNGGVRQVVGMWATVLSNCGAATDTVEG